MAEVELIRRHPTVSLIDVDDLIVRLTAVSDQVSRALGLMLGLVTVAALLVLLTQTQASMAHRRRELLLMRTWGRQRAAPEDVALGAGCQRPAGRAVRRHGG